MQHKGIPLTDDGNFLAYKSVRKDYKDHHSGQFDNSPGVVNEMPRNKISDDPRIECHEGFHVGALEYASTFKSDGRVVVCEVDPVDVVCIPYDYSQQKMRVSKYKVIGNHNGESLSSTTHVDDKYDDIPDADWDDSDQDDSYDDEQYDGVVTTSPPQPFDGSKTFKSSVALRPRGYSKLNKMSMHELLDVSTEELRKYATKGLKIVGASKLLVVK
jgi:hypothetical protein